MGFLQYSRIHSGDRSFCYTDTQKPSHHWMVVDAESHSHGGMVHHNALHMAWLTTPSNSIAWWAPWYGSLLLCWRFWLLISFFWLGSWRFCLSAGGLGFSGCLISRLLMVSPPLLLSCIPIFSALDDNILIITAFSFSKKVQSCISLVHRIQRQSQNDQLSSSSFNIAHNLKMHANFKIQQHRTHIYIRLSPGILQSSFFVGCSFSLKQRKAIYRKKKWKSNTRE